MNSGTFSRKSKTSAQISDSTEYEVFPAFEAPTKKGKSQVPPFEIRAIDPDDHPDEWNLAWPDHGFEANADELKRVAYKPVKQGGGVYVYYSTIFPPFSRIVDALKLENPTLLNLFRTEYEIWIAYHAILQESARPSVGDELQLEKLMEEERIRVANMQVKQALQNAKLREKYLLEGVAT